MEKPNEIYKYIDSNKILNHNEISDLLRKAHEYLQENNKTEEAKKCKWDRMITDLVIDPAYKNKEFAAQPFSPMLVGADGCIYPNIESFTDESLAYFESRAETTRNLFLQTRYNDFLWFKKKDHKRAKIAVEKYLELGNILFAKKEYLDSFQYFNRALSLSITLNNEQLITQSVSTIFNLIDQNIRNKENRWVIELAEMLIEHKKFLSSKELEGLANKILTAAKSYKSGQPNNLHIFRKIISLAERIYRRLDKTEKANSISLEIANSFEEDAKNKTEGYTIKSAVAVHYIKQALDVYQRLPGYNDKKKKLLLKIKELNEKTINNMKKFEERIEIPNEEIEKMLEPIRVASVDQIINYLIFEDNFLPSFEEALERAKGLSEKFVFSHIFSPEVLDHQNNIIYRAVTEEEKLEFQAIRNDLLLHYRLIYSIYFREVINILNNKGLKDKDIIKHFDGSPIISDDRVYILSVAIERFLSNDYISFIHIGALQIEGIIRDLLSIMGIPTSRVNEKGFFGERTYNSILGEDELKDLLGDRLYPFIKFTQSDIRGFNFRNYLAHGLMKYDFFDEFAACVILLILLKLCRFKIQKREENE